MQRIKTIPIFIVTIIFMLLPGAITAQDAIQITDQSWAADFRDHITFKLSAESPVEIVEVDLFYRISGQIATSRNEADFTSGKTIDAEFEFDQNDPSNYQPPGTEMEFWWKVVDADGNELKTDRETLLYLDDRYNWKTLDNENLTLYWYEGSDSFGQSLFDRANEALDTLALDIGITLEDPIRIFIYANQRDLLGAIRSSAQEWTGGQAFTNYGVVVIGVHPSQLDWGLNAMTHEMSHLVIHQATENPFSGLPRWLDEGIAVYNEDRDQLDADFRGTFERAVRNNELMTLRSLSSPFPADPLGANLAYGQSGAVVKFIIDTFGSEAMAELLAIFAEGALYDEALEQALGVDTIGLDNLFRASLELPPLPGTEVPEIETNVQQDSSSPEASDQAEIAVVEEQNSEEPAPVESDTVEEPAEEAMVEVPEESTSTELGTTSNEVDDVEEDQPANEPAPPANTGNNQLAAIPCAAGLIFLMMLGLAAYRLQFM